MPVTLAVISNAASGFSADGGGIGVLDGVVLVDNSTIAYNSAHSGGGVGILFGGAITVTNSTFAHNHTDSFETGDDIYLNAGTFYLRNSILAGVENCWILGDGQLNGSHNLITHTSYCDDNGGSAGRLKHAHQPEQRPGRQRRPDPHLRAAARQQRPPTPAPATAWAATACSHRHRPARHRPPARRGLRLHLAPFRARTGVGIEVTTTTDDLTSNGNCTLREAVQAANTNLAVDACAAGTSGLDTITLAAGTYALSLAGAGEDANATGDLDVTSALQIVGAGAATTIIDAAGLDRVLDVSGSAVFGLEALTVRNGYVTDSFGAGLRVSAGNALALTNVIVTNNWLNSGANWDSSGLRTNGPATVSGSQFISNTASNWGGGAYFGGATTITGSTFLSNTLVGGSNLGNGGGAYLAAAAAITNTTFQGNVAGNLGGGLYLANNASTVL